MIIQFSARYHWFDIGNHNLLLQECNPFHLEVIFVMVAKVDILLTFACC
jgi:hypothetical protein